MPEDESFKGKCQTCHQPYYGNTRFSAELRKQALTWHPGPPVWLLAMIGHIDAQAATLERVRVCVGRIRPSVLSEDWDWDHDDQESSMRVLFDIVAALSPAPAQAERRCQYHSDVMTCSVCKPAPVGWDEQEWRNRGCPEEPAPAQAVCERPCPGYPHYTACALAPAQAAEPALYTESEWQSMVQQLRDANDKAESRVAKLEDKNERLFEAAESWEAEVRRGQVLLASAQKAQTEAEHELRALQSRVAELEAQWQSSSTFAVSEALTALQSRVDEAAEILDVCWDELSPFKVTRALKVLRGK